MKGRRRRRWEDGGLFKYGDDANRGMDGATEEDEAQLSPKAKMRNEERQYYRVFE